MITAESRYRDSLVVNVAKPDGTDVQVITPSSATAYTFNFIYYIASAGDRIDTIANAFYGDPTQWYVVADANPEILDWSVIDPGTLLRIPSAQ